MKTALIFATLMLGGIGSQGNAQVGCLSVTTAGCHVSPCHPCSGMVTVTVANGVPPYTVLWSTGDTTVIDSPAVASQLNGLCPGKYGVTVTDVEGCLGKNYSLVLANGLDTIPPTVVCQNVITTINPSGCDAWAFPHHVDGGSYSDCAGESDLHLSFSPDPTDTVIVFLCGDLGVNTVTLYATDSAGNTATCSATITVQDNSEACPPQPATMVAGVIATESGETVAGVTVKLSGSSQSFALTGEDGAYSFNLQPNSIYTVTPSKNDDPLNGVTTYDLVLITRHVLGIQALDSPYKLIAADINKSGAVTTADVVELRKLILHISTEFPNNTSWRFVDKGYIFPNPANPWEEVFPEQISVSGAMTTNNADFVAIKIGDINGSANSLETELEDRFENEIPNGDLALPFPNPAYEFVFFPDTPEWIQVFDMQGRKIDVVYQAGRWNVRGLVPGLYAVRTPKKFHIRVAH